MTNSIIQKCLAAAVLVFCIVLISSCWTDSSRNTSAKDGDWETYSASPSPTKDAKSDTENNVNASADMTKTEETKAKSGGFTGNLPQGFNMPDDPVGKKMLKEYGAMFVAQNGAVPPKKVVFENESEVSAYQASVPTQTENIGGTTITLQTPAMNALKAAINEAKQSNLNITPRGADAAKRNYSGTVSLWESRVNPGLSHWVGKGKLQQSEANRIKSLPIPQQIAEIFKLEEQGMYFAKSLDKSIIYSVAPPGTSQHISMLALDVEEFQNQKVRQILANHGWHQTVVSDLPHFTFLGAKESELPSLGLKKVSGDGRVYWLPDI